MRTTLGVRQQSRLRTFTYWAMLLIAMVVLDDLTFGWIFWAIAQISPLLSAGVAVVFYWAMGYWITLRGLAPNPGRVATRLLKRLQLERKNPELRIREDELKLKMTSIITAVPLSLLFGGVVSTLWLWRNGVVNTPKARSVAFWLCGLYALEFGFIHGFGIGGSIFIARQ